jgi:hypothetical protein
MKMKKKSLTQRREGAEDTERRKKDEILISFAPPRLCVRNFSV